MNARPRMQSPGVLAQDGKDNDDGEKIPDNSDRLTLADCQKLCDQYSQCTAFEYNPRQWCVINTSDKIAKGTGSGSATCYIKAGSSGGGGKPGCADVGSQTMIAISGGEIQNCEEAVGAVVAAGGTCSTDLGVYEASLKGKTMADLCCVTCKNPGADPIEQVCAKEEATCTADLTEVGKSCWDTDNDGKNAICPDPADTSDPIKVHACIECIQEVFGRDYQACGCCVFPLLVKMDVAQDVAKAASAWFPCH